MDIGRGKRYVQRFYDESGCLVSYWAPACALRVTLEAEVHVEAIRAAIRDGRLSADRWAAEMLIDPAQRVTVAGWASLAEGWAAEPREFVLGHEMHLFGRALVTPVPPFKAIDDAQRPWRPLWQDLAEHEELERMTQEREADQRAWDATSAQGRVEVFASQAIPGGEPFQVTRVDGAWRLVSAGGGAEWVRESALHTGRRSHDRRS